jgi:glycosyltransferase involved in cell wall biosynthesis
VHLSNALLLASATDIRRHVGCPVVCSLSGEDVFVERVPEPHRSQVIGLMKEHAKDVALFTALNRYYADFMIDYVDLPRGRVHVVRHGLNLEGHGPRPQSNGEVVRLGYFARQCRDKGLHQLVAAFESLAKDRELDRVQLHVAGYLAKEDKPYLAELESRLRAAGIADRYVNHGELDRAQKIQFLQSLDVMCVPTEYRESKGISVLEALANEVPVVLPAHGAFPELIADTSGGVLFPPGDVPALAAELKRLLLDGRRSRQLGQAGRAAIVDRYHAAGMARETLALYRHAATRAGASDSR